MSERVPEQPRIELEARRSDVEEFSRLRAQVAAQAKVIEVARRHTCDVFRYEADEGTAYCEMCEALAVIGETEAL